MGDGKNYSWNAWVDGLAVPLGADVDASGDHGHAPKNVQQTASPKPKQQAGMLLCRSKASDAHSFFLRVQISSQEAL